ncbi:protein of unknown function [Latilactobacillus sakei]|nr:protein of unknown function [Latilactobacillus sakei]SON71951.1 protein of unknown function [Latilactobacillus sakei]
MIKTLEIYFYISFTATSIQKSLNIKPIKIIKLLI